ncbi:MAG: RNB domain-containing ribonuclease [Spirochaetaceae bacterium]|nr:RNB domain-containing ribonuclease [Spirochaetaceae bacterium]
MIATHALVLYKGQPALVQEESGGKYTIIYCSSLPSAGGKPAQFATQKVRDKDIFVLFNKTDGNKGLLPSLLSAELQDENCKELVEPLYELLIEEDEAFSTATSFADLCDYGGMGTAEQCWKLYKALKGSFFFQQQIDTLHFIPRPQEEITKLLEKSLAKEREEELRGAFIQRLKNRQLELPGDYQLMQDVEALALGKTEKSRTMKEAGLTETPEKAHKLLLDTGVWSIHKNPYPARWGLSMQSATEQLASPPQEERLVLDQVAYAIDNAWSADPDDAIAYDGSFVWVHIADPASSVLPDTPIDVSARHRGSTLYIPEGAARMLAEESLEDYALGLAEETGGLSRALSFKIQLDESGAILGCDVLKTQVKVQRFTYQQVDEQKDTPEFAPLFAIARRNEQRRLNNGAVAITLPEVHISVNGEQVDIHPSIHWESGDLVREFMLLAGEAAAKFAFKNNIPFPFVSQESPDLPSDPPPGLAGQYRLRRCMRSRSVGITPMQHAGLGLGMYSQVTSPLRRYSDLVAHQQLRAFIDGRPLLDKDKVLERISAGDAAASAAVRAERNSNLHWILVYLTMNPQWTGEAVVVEIRGKQAYCLIPSLAQETLLTPTTTVELNQVLQVKAGNINIPALSVTFQEVSQ